MDERSRALGQRGIRTDTVAVFTADTFVANTIHRDTVVADTIYIVAGDHGPVWLDVRFAGDRHRLRAAGDWQQRGHGRWLRAAQLERPRVVLIEQHGVEQYVVEQHVVAERDAGRAGRAVDGGIVERSACRSRRASGGGDRHVRQPVGIADLRNDDRYDRQPVGYGYVERVAWTSGKHAARTVDESVGVEHEHRHVVQRDVGTDAVGELPAVGLLSIRVPQSRHPVASARDTCARMSTTSIVRPLSRPVCC